MPDDSEPRDARMPHERSGEPQSPHTGGPARRAGQFLDTCHHGCHLLRRDRIERVMDPVITFPEGVDPVEVAETLASEVQRVIDGGGSLV